MAVPVLEAAIPDPMQVPLLLTSSPPSLATQCDVQGNEAEQVLIAVLDDGAIWVVPYNNNQLFQANLTLFALLLPTFGWCTSSCRVESDKG